MAYACDRCKIIFTEKVPCEAFIDITNYTHKKYIMDPLMLCEKCYDHVSAKLAEALKK